MMLPAEDAGVVRADLTRRFGLARWQITLSATDANRSAIRMARHATGRDKVLWFSYSCHGGVDETFAVASPGWSCPSTTCSSPRRQRPRPDADVHTQVFGEAVRTLFA